MSEAQLNRLSEQVQMSIEMSRQTQAMMAQFIEHIFPSIKVEFKADLAQQINLLRAEMKQDIADLRAEMKSMFAEVHGRLDGLAAEVSEVRQRLDYQIAKIARVEERVDLLKAQ